MKVLHVISALDPRTGGPAVALAGLTRAQKALGMDVQIVSTCRDTENLTVADELRAAGIAVTTIGPASGGLMRHPDIEPSVRRLVPAADIVHIHALWEEIQHQAARAAMACGKPYIIRPCGMLDPWSLAQSKWKKRIYMFWRLRKNLQRARALHFTSQTEGELIRPLKLRPESIVEPNGVELSEFQTLPARGTFRAKYSQLGDRPMVLFLSRIHPKKGLDLLVPAFAKANLGNAVLVIAGPDDAGYRQTVETMAASHGIADRVIFTGMLYGHDRLAALADADLFALPSYQENFGVAVVEALAAGCPVLISDAVNIWREIVDAGVGAAVPTKVEPLASELSRWMGNAALRQTARDKARAFVRERYDWTKIASRWADHYTRLCGK